MNEQVQEIFIEDIIPNRFQPRLTFDEKALQELSESIKVHGVIQPLVLRKAGNKFEIIAGERRYKASCMAGLKKVPAIVREMSDNESAEVALIENVQRKNLSSIEEAQSYRNLLDRGYLTQEDLASKLGVSQPTIANKLRLLNLCDEVQNALLNEQISERHARSLLAISNPDEQKNMLNRVIKERLTVKQLDNEIKKRQQNNNDDANGGAIMEPSNINTDATLEKNETEKPIKNIFGFAPEPTTDLEATAPNLNFGEEDQVPPISFNPFSPDIFASNDTNVQTEAPSQELETFDIFGNMSMPKENNTNLDSEIFPENPFSFLNTDTEVKNNVPIQGEQNIGDQINSIRNVIENVEKSGFKIEKEEYDFEDMYRIVINIRK